MKRRGNTAWGPLIQGCLTFVLMAALVIFGVRYLVERSDKKGKKGTSSSDFDADWRPYAKFLIRDFDIEMRESRRLYLVGSAVNSGTRTLRNARVRVTVAANLRGGQQRMKVLNLGQILPGQKREYNKYLYSMPGEGTTLHPGLCKIELVDMWFERKRREWNEG